MRRIGSLSLGCAVLVCACGVQEDAGSAVAGVAAPNEVTSPDSVMSPDRARALRRSLRRERGVELGSFPTQQRASLPFAIAEEAPTFARAIVAGATPRNGLLETLPSTHRASTFVVPSPITPMEDGSGRYVMRRRAFATFFTPSGLAFALSTPIQGEKDRTARPANRTRQGWGLHCTLVGGRHGALVAEEEQPARVRQYGGSRSRWTTELPTYGQLAWEEIYPGIDMITESARGALAYRFVLSPGAKVSDLVMRWAGATAVKVVDDGRGLDVETAIGVLRVRGLRAFAVNGDRRIELAARHVVHGSVQGNAPVNDVALRIDGWDGRTPLVIDPTIAWSSYLGGDDGSDSGARVAVDGNGNVFVTGETTSTDFPSGGGFDMTFNGQIDAFVTKVSASGALLWSSYLGGVGDEFGRDIAVDGSGNAFVTGLTNSTDFPSSGGFDTTYGGSYDAFVTKVSGTGALLWSSYLGGGLDDRGSGLTVDSNGNVFVTGQTLSTNFPSSGGFDMTFNGPVDAFVTKVSGTGALLWSSYLGGANGDYGADIAVDGSGNAFVTGYTLSTDFPSNGGFDTTFSGLGGYEGFVTKVSASGALLWSSYLGGNAEDLPQGIAVDFNGDAFVTGNTYSTDFPSSGGFDTTLGAALVWDAFVTKVSGTGALLWSSYLGGSSIEEGEGIAVDGSGNAFVTGTTSSTNFPSGGGFDTTFGGAWDAFVTKVSGNGALVWSSYLGGNGGNSSDHGRGISVDASGNVFVTGDTGSTDFPSSGGFDTTLGGAPGGVDAFVTKLGFSPLGAPCASASECQSSLCADGVCCDTACASSCEACTAAKKGGGIDGTCGPINGCCVTNAGCNDANVCTTDTCDTATSQCANTAIAGCCTQDAQCDDGDPCTTDSCNVVADQCVNAPNSPCTDASSGGAGGAGGIPTGGTAGTATGGVGGGGGALTGGTAGAATGGAAGSGTGGIADAAAGTTSGGGTAGSKDAGAADAGDDDDGDNDDGCGVPRANPRAPANLVWLIAGAALLRWRARRRR